MKGAFEDTCRLCGFRVGASTFHILFSTTIWVSVCVAVLLDVAVMIGIVLFDRKKNRFSRNNMTSGKFLLMTYSNWRIINFFSTYWLKEVACAPFSVINRIYWRHAFFFSTKTSWGFKRLIFYIKMAYLFVVLHTSIYQFILKITYNIRPANFSFTYFSVY